MKIALSQIPLEGVLIEEKINPKALDLETEIVKLPAPLIARAELSRITNAVTAKLSVEVEITLICSRCLTEFSANLRKNLVFSFPVEKETKIIDLNPLIREEIILDYPLKPLCKPDCKGLCFKCGKNLNEEKCTCK